MLRGAGLFGSVFGHVPSRDEWTTLNPSLMDRLYHTYRNSHTLRTLVRKLMRETLRGGVSIRQTGGRRKGALPVPMPPQSRSKKSSVKPGSKSQSAFEPDIQRLEPGEQARLMRTLEDAIEYGLLFGLVPVAMDEAHPGSLWVPPVPSGQFVARMDAHGHTQVGWQWRDRGIGADSAAPDRDVWVFVWENRKVLVDSGAPFDSVIQPLIPELMREQVLIEDDIQANYERSRPPLMLQENPRRDRESDERQLVELYLADYLQDPSGRMTGHGPGGTLTGEQRSLLRKDMGGSARASRSRRQGDRDFSGDARRLEVDPATGQLRESYRSLLWQRGAYTVPAGWVATAGFARPDLRGDLLAQRAHVTELVAAALGVPTQFAFGGSCVGGPSYQSSARQGSSSSSSSSTAGSSAGTAQRSAACEAMRDTVTAVRNELSAFYAQAHFQLLWAGEAVGLSHEVALGERLIQEDPESTTAMARQLELMGDSLRNAFIQRHDRRKRQTLALHRAAEIADQASKLWHGELIQQRIDAVLQVVAGVNDGSVGFPGDMSREAVQERERRGEGLQPADPRMMRDPKDLKGDPTEQPRSQRWIREGRSEIDMNEFAEPLHDKRERTKAEGRRVAGSTMMLMGDAGGAAGYQRRALTEEVPDLGEAMRKARDMVDARIRQMAEVERKRSRLSPASGERGETKVELVWLTPPVADWPLLKELALDDVLDPRVFQRMFLAHLGFDPATAAPKGTKPFARYDKEQQQQQKQQPSTQAKAKPKAKEPKATESKKRKQPEAKTSSGDGKKKKPAKSTATKPAASKDKPDKGDDEEKKKKRRKTDK